MTPISSSGASTRVEARTGLARKTLLSIACAAMLVAGAGLFTPAAAHYPRHYAGYFAPGYLGPQFGPGYYEVTLFPTTYYDLPPYEEPGYGYSYGYGHGYGYGPVSHCSARFRSYNPYTGTYLGWDGFPHTCP